MTKAENRRKLPLSFCLCFGARLRHRSSFSPDNGGFVVLPESCRNRRVLYPPSVFPQKIKVAGSITIELEDYSEPAWAPYALPSQASGLGYVPRLHNIELRRRQLNINNYCRTPGNSNSTSGSIGAGWTIRDFHRCGGGHGALELSVAEEWCRAFWRYIGKLYDLSDDDR